MDSEDLLECPTKNEENVLRDDCIEIEIPYNLYQYLSSGDCNVQNMCRICLSTDNDVLYPLLGTKENCILAHMYMAFTAVQLFPEDVLPSGICEPCQNQVVQCYEFKIKCEKSDCMLKSILRGEFITKEELPGLSMDLNQEKGENNITNNNASKHNNKKESKHFNENIDIKNESDSVEDEDINIKNESDSVEDEDIDINNESESVEDEKCLKDRSGNHSDDETLFIVQNIMKTNKRKTPCRKNGSNSLLKEITVKKSGREEKTFPCVVCSKILPKIQLFHAHMKNKHPNVKRLHACALCTESFNSDHDLKVHAALHTKGNIWKCNQCPKEFNAKSTFRRHISRHMESKRYQCDTCSKAFTELYALRRHVRVHTGELVEKKHVCNICDKRYSESGLLAAHMSRHIGLRPCECSTCGKRFPSKRLLASHRLVHSDRKPYACRYCEKRFRHESTRNTHHRTHTGEKPYVCSVCGKSFIQNSNLTLHMRTHTGERPYSCSICDSKFTSGSSLKTHERIHSGERPYSCNVCGKRFTRKNLSVHMRLHTGERPYECSVCSKKFVNATRLKDHQRVHTGEKPFDCERCTQKFATKSQLLKHSKSHQVSKKKRAENRELLLMQHVDPSPVITDRTMFNKEHGELIQVNENATPVESPENQSKEITFNIVQEVPIEVTRDLVLQDESNVKELLVVDNSQNNYQGDTICLNTSNVNIIDNNVSDVNLVTVNEGGVSISTASLEGTTVKLYQLDQSLVQISSSGGQVTISKITSKMTANF